MQDTVSSIFWFRSSAINCCAEEDPEKYEALMKTLERGLAEHNISTEDIVQHLVWVRQKAFPYPPMTCTRYDSKIDEMMFRLLRTARPPANHF